MNYIKHYLKFIKENLLLIIILIVLIFSTIFSPIRREIEANAENFLLLISSLENIVIAVLGLLIVTIIIFWVNTSTFYKNIINGYNPDKKLTEAAEHNQIKTKNTVYIWLKYIYTLIDEYNVIPKPIYMVMVYCGWLIGFLRFTVLGRWIAAIFTIYLVFGTYIQESHQQRLASFSNTIAQAEAFLQRKHHEQNEKSTTYYGSAIGLKRALEFLHKNKRDLDYLYLPYSQLSGIKLLGAKLNGSFFSGANLFRANFSGAYLWEVDFSEANLEGAVITATDFTGAKNLTENQIMQTCWLRAGTYRVDGKEIVIEDKDVAPPILPKHIKIDVHSLPKAKLGDKRGEIAYCP